MSFTLPDAAATERLGAALGRTCPWNSALPRAIYLKGELGAGKTTLVRGLLRALGENGSVRSRSAPARRCRYRICSSRCRWKPITAWLKY